MDKAVARLPVADVADTVPELDHLRATRPVCPVELPSGDTVWLVTRYADVKAVYQDRRFVRNLWNFPGSPRSVPVNDWSDTPYSMANLEGAEHTRRRQPVAEQLTAPKVQELRAATEKVADALLDRLPDRGGPVDLVACFAAPFPLLAVAAVVGLPVGDPEEFHREWWASTVPERYTRQEAVDTFQRRDTHLVELVAQRRAQPRDDLLTRLIEAGAAGRLDEAEIRMAVNEVVFGTLLNVKSTLAAGLLRLLAEHHHYQRLVERPETAGAVAEEVLRLYPHGTTSLLRLATEDVELAGVRVRRGEGVLLASIPANRDPRVYADPHEFRPGRDGPPQLAFGHGPHRCVGAALGRMYLEVALAALARRLPGLTLAGAPEEVRWDNYLHEHSPAELPVNW